MPKAASDNPLVTLISFALAAGCVWYFWPRDAPKRADPPAAVPAFHAPIASAEKQATPRLRLIPGIAAPDVYHELESRGFLRQDPRTANDPLYGTLSFWDFARPGEHQNVRMSGLGRLVADIQVVTFHLSGEPVLSRDVVWLFDYVAAIKYDGSTPDEARRWVKENLGDQASQVFGPVRYDLSRSGGMLILNLTLQPEDPQVMRAAQ